jgi:hypothetical protein
MASRNELNSRARGLGLDPSTYPNDSKLEQKILYLEKNATTFTGTLATGTITTTNTFSNGETITIGDIVYTMRTALTEARATQTLTVSGVFSNGERVTVDGITYTMRTALTSPSVEYEVLIGVSAAVSLDNLLLAINAGAGAGTNYSTGTRAHPRVTATTNGDTTQVVEYIAVGTVGNSALVSETCANASWGAATLTGGVNPVANEIVIGGSAAISLDNIQTTVNGTGQGTTCSSNTGAHPQVTATTNGATTQVVQAIDFAVTNASIATTETCANASWGAATLASGVAGVVAVAGAGTRDTNAGIAGDRNV